MIGNIDKYRAEIRRDAVTNSDTRENSRHQSRLLGQVARNANQLEAAGIDLRNLSASIVVSDYGKRADAKTLLTTDSPESQLLISTLQGNATNKASAAIRDILSENFGSERARLIANDLTIAEVQKQFRENPLLTGVFHELPGLLLLIQDYNAGHLNDADFKTQFLGTTFHNGPEEGFWAGLMSMADGLKASKGVTLLKNTVFEDAAGKARYPSPLTAAGIVHANFDRYDQAVDGIPKIAKEISGFKDIDDLNFNLLGTNPDLTSKQLAKLKTDSASAIKDSSVLGVVQSLIQTAQDGVQRFADYIKPRLSWKAEGETKELTFEHADGSREILRKLANDKYEHHIEVKQSSNRQQFMAENGAGFLGRVVRGFNEEDRYANQAA